MRRLLLAAAVGGLLTACAASPPPIDARTPAALTSRPDAPSTTPGTPGTVLTPSPGGAEYGSCSAISDSARKTADAYAEMLEAEGLVSSQVFVSALAVDDNGLPLAGGHIDAGALRCLWGQHRNVTIVSGPDDPALPTKPVSGRLRELPDGPLIMFGDVDLPRDHTTFIAIDRGGGDWRSIGYDVRVDSTNIARVEPNGHMAIS